MKDVRVTIDNKRLHRVDRFAKKDMYRKVFHARAVVYKAFEGTRSSPNCLTAPPGASSISIHAQR